MQFFVAEMAMFAQQVIPLFVTERKETRNIEDMYHLFACTPMHPHDLPREVNLLAMATWKGTNDVDFICIPSKRVVWIT